MKKAYVAILLAGVLLPPHEASAHHAGPTGFSGSALSQSSIHWSWSDSADSDKVYRVLAQDGSDLSGNLPAGTSGWTETGLAPGASYTRRVVSFQVDHEAASDDSTASTLPADPIVVSPPNFQGSPQDQDTIVWSWSDVDGETGYRVEDSGGSPVSGDLPSGSNSWTENGLAPGTSYTRRVAAFNASSQATSADASATTPPAPPPTLTGPPNFQGQPLGPDSLRWTWSDVDGETGYRVEDSGGTNLSGVLPSGFMLWDETGLSPSTSYTRRVVAFNDTAQAPSSFDTATTAAAPGNNDDLDDPRDFRGQGVSPNSILWTWREVDNELGYRVVDMNEVSVSGDLPPGTQAWTETGLAPSTPYRRRVIVFNATNQKRSGADTASTLDGGPISFPPPPPGNFGAVAATENSLTWAWSDVLNEDAYRVETPEGAPVSGMLPRDTTLYTELGLGPNQGVSRRVTAYNSDGAGSSGAVSRFTLAVAPSGAALTALDYFTLQANWSSNGNPAGTAYRAELLHGGTLAMVREGAATEAVFSGLAAETTYTVRIAALNGDGVASSAVTASATTPPLPSNYIDPAAGKVLDFFLASGLVTVNVPPGAFAQPVLLSLREPAQALSGPTPESRLSATGFTFEMVTDKDLQPLKPLLLDVTYRDLADPRVPEAELTLARLDETVGRWAPLPSRVDPAANRLEASVDHLSTFQVMHLTPSASVGNAIVFPNPFQPSKGHTSVQFDRLPAGSRVRVYTLAGELVRELTADTTGTAVWNGAAETASGVYFIQLEGEGGTHTMKMVIQR